MTSTDEYVARADELIGAPSDYKLRKEVKRKRKRFIQWLSRDKVLFIPGTHAYPQVPNGLYVIRRNADLGEHLMYVPVDTEDLLEFPESASKRVLDNIKIFWKKEHIFKQYKKLRYRRGILLYGPPGGGKTSTIKLAMQYLIKDLNGIVFKMEDPYLFESMMKIFRDIEQDRKVIVIIEDIDALIDQYSESLILNILDGVDHFENVVFIATTNYPEKLCERVINRPSRFDIIEKIGLPNEETRKIYLESLAETYKDLLKDTGFNLSTWVKDTQDFSVAHLKELFTGVVILGGTYDNTLSIIKGRFDKISSEQEKGKAGFGQAGFKKK